jgi:SAM-dependent methyltransferase
VRILNLGCGTKVSPRPEVINIDWSIYLRLRKATVLRPIVPLLATGERRERFRSLGDNIRVHDIARGLPFPADSIDAVYHSHLLEHLDRTAAPALLREVRRVLRPGGIHRIVVPDFERLCAEYLRHLAMVDAGVAPAAAHEPFIAAIIEQSVRRESFGTSRQRPLRRWVENLVLGDARRRGETHQWMYDRVTLRDLLSDLGYRNAAVMRYDRSRVPDWTSYGLDSVEGGGEYKPGSLYVEAEK